MAVVSIWARGASLVIGQADDTALAAGCYAYLKAFSHLELLTKHCIAFSRFSFLHLTS